MKYITKALLFLLAIVFNTSYSAQAESHATAHVIRVPLKHKMVVLTIDNTVSGINKNIITQFNTSSSEQYQQAPLQHVPALPGPATAESFFSVRGILNTFWHNKVRCGIGLVLSLYGTILATILHKAHTTTHPGIWASWRLDIPLTALHALPPHEVASELRMAIKKQYRADNHSLSDVETIHQFMNDVTQEIAQHTTLCTLYEWINTVRVSWLFPKQQQALERARYAIDRLTFLKQILNQAITI